MIRPALLPALALLIGLAGCASAPREPAGERQTARFHLEAASGQGAPLVLPRSGTAIRVNPQPVITEGDLVNVELVQVELGRCLMFQLSPSAARDLYRLTGANQGRRLVLVIDGAALGARRIDGPLTDGVVYCFAEVDDTDLPGMVERLRRGAGARSPGTGARRG